MHLTRPMDEARSKSTFTEVLLEKAFCTPPKVKNAFANTGSPGRR